MKKILMTAAFAGAVMFIAAGCCGAGKDCAKSSCELPAACVEKCVCPDKGKCKTDAKACAQAKCTPCATKTVCPQTACPAK